MTIAPVPQPLDSQEHLEAALTRSEREPVVLFKHSLTCGISFAARRQILLMTEPSDPPVFEVVIQQARSLSQEIARRLDVRHESPQAILVYRQRAVYVATHHSIRAVTLRGTANESRSP